MEKTWIFLGRVQPTHIGYIDAYRQAISAWVTQILTCICSSNKEHTPDNPFSFGERSEMIKLLLTNPELVNEQIIKDSAQRIYSIPDFFDSANHIKQWLNTDDLWRNYIIDNLPKFEYVITWNPRVWDIFEKAWYKVILLQRKVQISASNLRERLAQNKRSKLEEFVPSKILEYIESIWWFERLKNLYKNILIPKLAADIILFDENWNLILVERKFPPYWLALPWWMVDYWESPYTAAIREAKEELWVDIQIDQEEHAPLWVFGKPDRDPRQHTVSIVYSGKIIWWRLKAWDDAKKIITLPLKDIKKEMLAFDHFDIINKLIKNLAN